MTRPFYAARWEERLNRFLSRLARRRGWQERVLAYTSYGSGDFVRVMARLVLGPPQSPLWTLTEPLLRRRGWRNFFTITVPDGRITIRVGDREVEAPTDRNGYVDCRLDVSLEPGWHEAHLSTASGAENTSPTLVVDSEQTFGIISDIDDTVISTYLPRPLIAAWNTFVLHETARQAVPGMADMYRTVLQEHPGAPVFYVSTGAWNTAGTLARFLRARNFPVGPLLLTDWGPTNTGWFRSGMEHKKSALRQLAIDFPNICWLLVGDDGQHDPFIYGEFAAKHPDRVRGIALRQLSPAESLLAHGTVTGRQDDAADRAHTPVATGADGHALLPLVERITSL